MLCIGIDEAGYGPKIGPLIMSSTAFSCNSQSHFKESLKDYIKDGKNGTLIIDDSKRVYRSGSGFKRLESSVLSFLSMVGCKFDNLQDLLESLHINIDDDLVWYKKFADVTLPLESSRNFIIDISEKIKEAMRDNDISIEGIWSCLLFAPDFNAAADLYKNKSKVLWLLFTKVISSMMLDMDIDGGDVCVDKHGGRNFYKTDLEKLFGERIVTLKEGRNSSYLIVRPHTKISFNVSADVDSIFVALASMVSKYIRELFMNRLNEFFKKKVGAARTAGYSPHVDSFIAEVNPYLLSSGLDPSLLIRSR